MQIDLLICNNILIYQVNVVVNDGACGNAQMAAICFQLYLFSMTQSA